MAEEAADATGDAADDGCLRSLGLAQPVEAATSAHTAESEAAASLTDATSEPAMNDGTAPDREASDATEPFDASEVAALTDRYARECVLCVASSKEPVASTALASLDVTASIVTAFAVIECP
jgi:hypothetical protein